VKLGGKGITAGMVLAAILIVVYFSYPPTYKSIVFPDGKKFAFAIVDDTDGATKENIKPVYDFLHEMGIYGTKTVWMLPTNDPNHWPNHGTSLADSDYTAFVLDLQSKGFEIALHGVRGGHSTREQILQSLEKFERLFGHSPRIHINHSQNFDNLYWGAGKLGTFPMATLYGLFFETAPSHGQDPESEYFWGDVAKDRISYVVNFSFHDINILKKNPLIPYHDPKKPYVNYWFHSSDGGFVDTFNELISKDNVDRLEREGGVCFVYTHLASGFFKNGVLDPTFKERITYLASRDGWFAPASEILDYIRDYRGREISIGFRERVHLEFKWLLEKLIHGAT